MAWRETFLNNFGPGLLGGITFGDWLRLLGENRFAVAPRSILRAMTIAVHGCQNSVIRLIEDLRFGSTLANVHVAPPVFVLGHYRSGTTHLHNLLTTDTRFAFPNMYQVMFPHTFLSTEKLGARTMSFMLNKTRPMDNVEWNALSPQEDEFALCIDSFKSPCMGWVFPQRQAEYDKYLTFRGVPEREIAEWSDALLRFMGKLTLKYERPLILKSPPHTARIALLLKLFPKAKFVHIHRNPYTVFQSSVKTFKVNACVALQRMPPDNELNDWTLRQYQQMYESFFEERTLIPLGNYHEMGFEDLERDPIGEMQRLYSALNLPEFAQVEPALMRYVDSLQGYKKNEFPTLPLELRERIAEMWRPSFAEWGYEE